MCLQIIAFASPPLSILQLQQALSTPETSDSWLADSDLISEQEIARLCIGLIRKSQDGEHFEFAHYTVWEFLVEEALNEEHTMRYHLFETRGYPVIATQCLRFLQLQDFNRRLKKSKVKDEIAQRTRDYPFYEYAVRFWPKYARNHLGDPVVFELAKSLLRPPKNKKARIPPRFHAMSIGLLHYLISTFSSRDLGKSNTVEDIADLVLHDVWTPLHLAALLHLPEICSFIVKEDPEAIHHANGRWGTPLELAVASVTAFDVDPGMPPTPYRESYFRSIQLPEAAAQQKRTLEVLLAVGAEFPDPPSITMGNRSLLQAAIIVGTRLGDFSAVIQILSHGIQVSGGDVKVLESCLHSWAELGEDSRTLTNPKADDVFSSRADALLDLIQGLPSTFLQSESTFGFKFAMAAWKAAIELRCPFAKQTDIVDPRISCSDEVLLAHTIAAVRSDDTDRLAWFLDNPRLDITTPHKYQVDGTYCEDTLIHIAVKSQSIEAVDLLRDAGCCVHTANSEGVLPIHDCFRHKNDDILRMLLAEGSSPLTQDRRGYNLWHYVSEDPEDGLHILEHLVCLDVDEVMRGLQSETNAGDTPLKLALRGKRHDCYPEAEDKALCIMRHSGRSRALWLDQGSLLSLAAAYGSQAVLGQFLEAGVARSPIGKYKLGALHCLGTGATVKCATTLTRLLPDARGQLFRGKSAVQLYIERSLMRPETPNTEIINLLCSQKAMSFRGTDGGMLWDTVCRMVIEQAKRVATPNSAPFDSTLRCLVKAGAMECYETTTGESGLVALFQGVRTHSDVLAFGRATIREAIAQSRHWDKMKGTAEAATLLKTAIRHKSLDVVKELLEQGVGVHTRADGLSALEYALEISCNLGWNRMGRDILSIIMHHSKPEMLNDLSPHAPGFGLLHRLAHSSDDPDIQEEVCGLIRDLVERGVDMNQEARFIQGCTALSHHLDLSSFATASVLLELGANPMAGGLDPVRKAVERGGVSFLRNLRNSPINISWTNTYPLAYRDEGRTRKTSGCTLLLVAAKFGQNECLEFLFLEGLAGNVNNASQDGYTAVHIAASEGHAHTIKALHARGASLVSMTNEERTPLDMAVRNDQLGTIEMLTRLGAVNSITPIIQDSIFSSHAKNARKKIRR